MANWCGDPSEFKVYWFSRDLVASRFGGYANREPDTLRTLSSRLDKMLSEKRSVDEMEKVVRESILGAVSRHHGNDISKRYRQTEDLTERIVSRIESRRDIRELQIAIESVIRTGDILDETPIFGRDEITEIVDNTIENRTGSPDPSRAYSALFNVDMEGETYQLGAQREPLVEYVTDLTRKLERKGREQADISRIVSGVVQEYERRAGQSRSSTAGNVLETALQYIFERFGIPASGAPSHFGDLEIDNIAEGPEGKIGFSCKRTLRERFRQSLSRQAEIGVDEIWFVALMMADVSREKLEDISNDGGRLYVPQESFVWEQYSGDKQLSYTLRPAEDFLYDVSEFVGGDL